MEFRCKVCGTINDSNSRICNGCLQPLDDKNELKKFDHANSNTYNANQISKNDSSDYITDNSKYSESKNDYTIKGPILLYIKYFIYTFILSLIVGFISSLIDGVMIVFFKLEITIIINIIAKILVYYIAISEIFKKEKQIPEKEKNWILLIIMFLDPIIVQIIYEILLYISNGYIIIYNFCINFIVTLLISTVIVNYTNYVIDNTREEKNQSKSLIILNIISCIMIIILLAFGIYVKKSDLKFYNSILHDINNEENNIDDSVVNIESYIDSIEHQILVNEIELNEDIPNAITDVNYVEFDKQKPDSINLNVDIEESIISSGKIVYDGITYLYDGENVTKK